MKLSHIFKDSIIEEAKKVKKPSSGLTKKQKSAVSKKAKAGKDIGKKGKGFEKVAAKAAKTYGSKEIGRKVAAASMWKNIAKKGKKMMKESTDMDEIRISNTAGNEVPSQYSKEPELSAYWAVKRLLGKNNDNKKKTLEDIVKYQDGLKDINSVENAKKHKLFLTMEKIVREMIGEQKISEKKNSEKDPEGQMAKVQLKKIAGYADKISKELKDESQLDAWVQDHIAKASELMDQVGHFMDGKK
jgi:hypothetical protein